MENIVEGRPHPHKCCSGKCIFGKKHTPKNREKKKKKRLKRAFHWTDYQHYIIHKNVWICSYKHFSATCHYPLKYTWHLQRVRHSVGIHFYTYTSYVHDNVLWWCLMRINISQHAALWLRSYALDRRALVSIQMTHWKPPHKGSHIETTVLLFWNSLFLGGGHLKQWMLW